MKNIFLFVILFIQSKSNLKSEFFIIFITLRFYGFLLIDPEFGIDWKSVLPTLYGMKMILYFSFNLPFYRVRHKNLLKVTLYIKKNGFTRSH